MSKSSVSGISTPVMGVLLSLSICHCCNDALQAVVTSLYPMLKDDLVLDFAQIGIITLFYQMSASVLQPLVGFIFDRRPSPWTLVLAACFTFSGLSVLAFASTFWGVIASVVLIGTGSSIVHPEASRMTSLASGGRKGLAQSIFQVGGNLGGSIGPLLAAFVIAPYGRENTFLVAFLAFVGIAFSIFVGRWYMAQLIASGRYGKSAAARKVIHKGDEGWIDRPYSDKRTYFYIGILLILIFSKYVYMASVSSYFTFYTIEKFGLVCRSRSMLFLSLFLQQLLERCVEDLSVIKSVVNMLSGFRYWGQLHSLWHCRI